MSCFVVCSSKMLTALSALTSTASAARNCFLDSPHLASFRQLIVASTSAATRASMCRGVARLILTLELITCRCAVEAFFFANKLARTEAKARALFTRPEVGLLELAVAALSEQDDDRYVAVVASAERFC
jgi:1-aminocyclopropane-1-carboxylate deaminase/D-cysteine desulfhydrase-like pyridoxal-dependent ACC family enzyme